MCNINGWRDGWSVVFLLFKLVKELHVGSLHDCVQVECLHGFLWLPKAIEKVVRTAAHQLLIATVLSYGLHAAVIEVIPLAIKRVLAVGSVMAETYAAKVVRDSVAVVSQIPAVLLLRTENKGTQVESFKRELDEGVDFLTPSEAILVASSFEPL